MNKISKIIFFFFLVGIIAGTACNSRNQLPTSAKDQSTETSSTKPLYKASSAVRDDVTIIESVINNTGTYEMVNSFVTSWDVNNKVTGEAGTFTVYPYQGIGSSDGKGAATFVLEMPSSHITRTVMFSFQSTYLNRPDVLLYGIFGSDLVTISGKVKINYYEPDLLNGKLSWDNMGIFNAGIVRSNGAVNVRGNVFINGDVLAGPDYLVNISGRPVITGSSYSALSSMDVPIINEITAFGSDLILTSSEIKLTSGEYHYNNVEIDGNALMNIAGKVSIYCNKFILKGHSSIKLNKGDVYIYCNEYIQESNSKCNEGGIKGCSFNLKIYCSGKQVTIRGNSILYARIYAPKANISITGDACISGMVAGKTVDVSGNVNVYYDRFQLYAPLNMELAQMATIQNGYGFVNGQLCSFNANDEELLGVFSGLEIKY